MFFLTKHSPISKFAENVNMCMLDLWLERDLLFSVRILLGSASISAFSITMFSCIIF